MKLLAIGVFFLVAASVSARKVQKCYPIGEIPEKYERPEWEEWPEKHERPEREEWPEKHERPEREEWPEKHERPEREEWPEKHERPEREEWPEKHERPEREEWPEKHERPEREEWPEKHERPEREEWPEKHERPEREEWPEKHERPEWEEWPEKHERPEREEWPEKHERPEREEWPEKHERPEREEWPEKHERPEWEEWPEKHERPEPICKRPHEEYFACSPLCEDLTCENPEPRYCKRPCEPRCLCEEGYVRNVDGECVKPCDCPDAPTCPTNEVYSQCGVPASCEATCSNPEGTLCYAACEPKCVCAEGYVRNQEGGECVKLEECEPPCSRLEFYSQCNAYPNCNPSCDNPKGPFICPKKCVPGCVCKEGLVRDRNGNCIEECDCPKNDECVGDNQEYDNCTNVCDDPSCSSNTYKYCDMPPGWCHEKCLCQEGYLRNENDECVAVEDCFPGEPINPQIGCREYIKTGPCKAAFKRYAYSSEDQTCVEFTYGGCDANNNNFETLAECLNSCSSYIAAEPICKRPHEEYIACSSLCEDLTCENPEPHYCKRQCEPRCLCEEGYVRNNEGFCVKLEECPAKTCDDPNEEYSYCGSACTETCANPTAAGIFCIQACIEGCFCKEGYLRDDNGKCVDKDECTSTCPGRDNEEFIECDTSCPLTCDNPYDPIPCDKKCNRRCACKDGYVRDVNYKCVKIEECPSVQPICSAANHEHYEECGTACPDTCQNFNDKNRFCTLQCVQGCFCDEGYVRNYEGDCVLPIECNEEICTKVNEEYTCGTVCPYTCDNYTEPFICTKQCRFGCHCKDGFVLDDQGTCILPEQCPAIDHGKCTQRHEEYHKCTFSCDGTCNSPAKRLCRRTCAPKCLCKDGYVRNKKGICTLYKQCIDIPSESCDDDDKYDSHYRSEESSYSRSESNSRSYRKH